MIDYPKIATEIYQTECCFKKDIMNDDRLSPAAKAIWINLNREDCDPKVIYYFKNLPEGHLFYDPVHELYIYGYILNDGT